MKEYLTTKQMCEWLGVNRGTLRQYVLLGKVPEPSKLSKRTLRWDRQEVENWMRRQKDD